MVSLGKLSEWFSKPEGIERMLGFAAILAFGLGFWQIRNAIALPFVPKLPVGSSALATEDALSQLDGTALRNRDTDGDGLSDYDEVNLYRTSMYLKDTDSDGFDDKTEVESGNDPLCPRDTNCSLLAQASNVSQVGEQVATPTAAELRQLLKDNGLPESELAKYDDAQLIQLYKELAGEESASSGVSETSGVGAVSAAQKESISKMSGAELRAVLIQAGADEETLQKVDDATLKAMVLETIGS